jgi:hypothetical protein
MRIRSSIKSLLKHLHRHEKTQEDIFIFTLPRTGSTLLAEILNTDPFTKTVSEPLALNRDNLQVLRRYFPEDFPIERYVDISPENLQRMYGYFEDLSKGKTWNSYYWSDLRSGFHRFTSERTLFKTHRLTYYFEDFMQHFKDDFGLYLLRHPVSHSFSRLKLGWDPYIDLYAASPKIRNLLSKEARSKIREVLAYGSQLEKFVLSWCLENYVFLHKLKSGSLPDHIFPVFYEELVRSPEKTIREICMRVNMEYNEGMLSRVKVPSSGIVHSSEDAETQILAGNTDYLTQRWRQSIDEQGLEKVQDILNKLGITIYKDI